MKITTECVPCLIKRIIFEAEHSTKDKKLRTKAIKLSCKALAEFYDPDKSSASIATKVHKIAYETLGDNDPYKDLKSKSNEVAKELLPKVERLIKKSNQPLKTAIICSIIGNMMDFGIDGASSSPEKLSEIFESYYSEGLGYDDYDKVEKFFSKSKKVILFTDNCGEIVFDKLLCRELKKKYKNIYLTVVVKGENILSDATLKDAEEFNFLEVVDEIMTTGCFAIGVDFEKMVGELKKSLKEADLIICKGMANYEAFSETDYKPIVYLLRAKCDPIASSMGLKKGISVIKLYD